jgi:hypothetical protein
VKPDNRLCRLPLAEKHPLLPLRRRGIPMFEQLAGDRRHAAIVVPPPSVDSTPNLVHALQRNKHLMQQRPAAPSARRPDEVTRVTPGFNHMRSLLLALVKIDDLPVARRLVEWPIDDRLVDKRSPCLACLDGRIKQRRHYSLPTS